MEFKILNWNVGGTKYLELETKEKKEAFRKRLNENLNDLIKKRPHVICLQEIVEYYEPNEPKKNLIDEPNGYKPDKIIDTPNDYNLHSSILIDNIRHPYVSKWEKVRDQGNWKSGSYFGQGNALLWLKDLPHFPVHSLPEIGTKFDDKSHVDEIILKSGLYFGTRDTEPRAALLAHFMITKDSDTENKKIPVDIFVINLHLTTLTGEREGIPKVDEMASGMRKEQLSIVLNEIVSPYNEWKLNRYPHRGRIRAHPEQGEDFNRGPPIWILCGDFNFTPSSEEYKKMESMNFVDHNPNKGRGTKGKWIGSQITQATITCDYIFAGPKFTSLDPRIVDHNIKDNPLPLTDVKVSDHYPLYAKVDIPDSAILPEDK